MGIGTELALIPAFQAFCRELMDIKKDQALICCTEEDPVKVQRAQGAVKVLDQVFDIPGLLDCAEAAAEADEVF